MKLAKQTLLTQIDRLLVVGTEVSKKTKSSPQLNMVSVSIREMDEWRSQLQALMESLDGMVPVWQSAIEKSVSYSLQEANKLLGMLSGIRSSIENELLVKVDQLVVAETFADLLEQADYLMSEGYHVAAGVLGRAVLEEHLRRWCDRENCPPAKPVGKRTVADYNMSLYTAKLLDKIQMTRVDGMRTIGNAAAHNDATLKSDDVKRLLIDVRDFIAKYGPN